MVLPDMHFPYQEQEALDCVLSAVCVLRPDEIVLNGDNLDAAAFSSHPARTFDDRAPSFLATEVGPLNAYLDKLQGRNHRPLVYCEGNHEQRIERHLLNAGAAGRDLYALSSAKRLIAQRVDQNGQAQRPRKRHTWLPYYGKGVHSHYLLTPALKHASALGVIHGWSHAKNAAAMVLAAARDMSIVFGHTHRIETKVSRFRVGPHKDVQIQARSFGCLRDLYPAYTSQSPSDWSHAFGVVYIHQHTWQIFTVDIARDGSCILPSGRRVVG